MPLLRWLLPEPPTGTARYYGHPYRSSGSGDWASSTASLVALLTIALLVVTAYWVFRAIWLVVRVIWQHPHERRLWVALGACLGSWTLVGLLPAVTTLPPAGFWLLYAEALSVTAVLLIAAKVVEWRDDRLLQRPLSKETLIEDVLTRPWWKAA